MKPVIQSFHSQNELYEERVGRERLPYNPIPIKNKAVIPKVTDLLFCLCFLFSKNYVHNKVRDYTEILPLEALARECVSFCIKEKWVFTSDAECCRQFCVLSASDVIVEKQRKFERARMSAQMTCNVDCGEESVPDDWEFTWIPTEIQISHILAFCPVPFGRLFRERETSV